ncbi:nitrate ABC transporter ATP-binding protein [Anaerosporomusa subterranea]|uniref:Nitrate ABC transporter ATP-binding protein n=1 Tax=Anaerosporomusa subterranea TaxID=1794912 RepID=A0A154BXL3_ANASB|nr:ABC transporter ATP-binding protein [Anaerosporomusa subterranea]KYZ78218.1 nitrate ABC transporter ATP-binding protein [Anaerosporomusa subterranea]
MRIVIEDVTKTYPGTNGESLTALDQINLTINPEEFVVLVGPSGCGKSTLLNMVGGLLSPSSGSIYVEGLTEDRDPAIGVVFQEIGLFPWRTVSQNIAFGLEELGLSAEEQAKRLSRYMTLVGLNGFEQSYPHQLSGGMRQRVGIARALAIEPDVLLMDEPFSALDAQTRTLMQEELLDIWHKTRLSTLYVTHNIQEAVYLADRVVVLSRRPGRIIRIISIEMPKRERGSAAYSAQFAEYADKIWGLIRKDAEDALREGIS